MSTSALFEPLTFRRGRAMNNRFAVAPLTNLQSPDDGHISDDEFNWLVMRAKGGFGMVMTCAAHVQRTGQGFPGQLGVFSDSHLEGLTRLATAIKAQGSLAFTQLHHAGIRSPSELIGGQPVGPSDDAETGSRAMTGAEVEAAIEAYIAAAERSQKAGFDGVELHGAHGYLIAQFISPEINQRTDRYGGSLENRARFLNEIIDGVRARCGEAFQLGVRLSPERFGLKLAEIRDLAAELLSGGKIEFLDLSLWNAFKEPEEDEFKGRTLASYFTDLDRGQTRLGAAGKIMTPGDAVRTMDAGMDFVFLGRAAILHHDYPQRVKADGGFQPIALPVTKDYLRQEGLGEPFVNYMSTWKGFVAA
jgi:2,4-dienoyl-CoA reductase-like NADH-dependent reductase (Old Yellow Enzyme family)